MRLSTEPNDPGGRAEYERWMARGWRVKVAIDGIDTKDLGAVLTADTDAGMIRYVPFDSLDSDQLEPYQDRILKMRSCRENLIVVVRYGIVTINRGIR